MSSFTLKTSATVSRYEGSDLDEWMEHFSFSDSIKEVINEIGVKDLSDLAEVYMDAEIMAEIKSKLNMIDFRKFKEAGTKTKVFAGMPFAMGTTVVATPVVATPVVTGKSAETIALEKAIAEEKALREKEARKHGTTDSSSKTKAQLEAELKALQSERTEKAKDEQKKKEEVLRLKNKIAKTKERKQLIKDLGEILKTAASLDICFVLDCTGSMSGHMKSMQEKIQELATNCKTLYPDVPLRLAFVGYRDHCDGDRRLAVERFTDDLSVFKNKVAEQKADGGGDAPEDVFGALKVASDMEWRSATRILYHICDAPCHGSRFHNLSDNYPDGDPHGLKAEDLLPAIIGKNIQYIFGKIDKCTDKMVDIFNGIIGGSENAIEVTDVKDAETMMSTISKSVTSSLSSSVSFSASTVTKIDAEHVVIDESEPNWAVIKKEHVNKFIRRPPGSISELVAGDNDVLVEPIPTVVEMQCGEQPFAKGACRAAYHAKEFNKSGIPTRVVHKVSLSTKSKDLTRQKYEVDGISSQAAAIYLAEEFMKVLKTIGGSYPSVQFSDACLLQYLERHETPYCTQEIALDGVWEKYNNNHGLVISNPTPQGTNHDIIQAFSHWTHTITEGTMIVVDCQGVFNKSKNAFLLTDPAIHCKDVTRFGGTNLHVSGISRFFATHKCNSCCKALSLPEGR
eukprot:TRINITY_DN63263_c1_g2_i1.p1 TRINITY_DN63263_c1_g2~~TRINITY_DN63263_c1_g2_i1.p1  ORF type:complete len:681 (+),score=10.69 TRINITY_DN63263_c1_g2_i1:82-2124(+)